MMKKQVYIFFVVLCACAWLCGSVVFTGCANRGVGPQGGPKDSIPPVPKVSVPEQGTLNFKGNHIEVTFDEYIQLDNIASNLLMSPPQQTPPEVKARGKKLMVQFQDTLRDSTTYTIDFGSAVCDFREKVPLHGYSFYFSTGPEIDTLELRGRVYDAETLNPVQGVMTGIHSNLADSAFVSSPFLRIAKTDSAGGFRIGNIHPGTYRLYALDDISRDYRLTVGESLAFADSLYTVAAPDTAAGDSVKQTVLFLFKEQQQRLYLQRTLRDKQHMITVLFSAPPDSLPLFEPLQDSLNCHVQFSSKADTAVIWLLDSTAIARDSLFFAIRYRRTDSLYRLEWATDTIRAVWRAPGLTAKAKEALERQNRNRRLEIRTNARKTFELYDTLRLNCTTPLARIDRNAIHLYERIDTLLKPVSFSLAPYDTLPMKLTCIADLKAGGAYELQLDSGALHDVYGITHVAAKYPLQVKALADYSTLRVRLKPYEPAARIQILDGKDKVVRELPAQEDGTFFEHLKPDTYYMRLYLDTDGNGQWTTGSWNLRRQPERVYYFPGKIQTKSNWDFEEEWDYTAVPQTESKPAGLVTVSSPSKKK